MKLNDELFEITIYDAPVQELICSIESISQTGILVSFKPPRTKKIIKKLIPIQQLIMINGEPGTSGLIVYKPIEKVVKHTVYGFLKKSKLPGFHKFIPENSADPFYIRLEGTQIEVVTSTKTLKKRKR